MEFEFENRYAVPKQKKQVDKNYVCWEVEYEKRFGLKLFSIAYFQCGNANVLYEFEWDSVNGKIDVDPYFVVARFSRETPGSTYIARELRDEKTENKQCVN